MKQSMQHNKKTMQFPSYSSQTKLKKNQFALYRIINKKSYLALIQQIKVNPIHFNQEQDEPKGNKIMATFQNKNKINQLWSLNQIDKKNNKKQYQIVNTQSNLALQVKGQKVYLASPEWKKQQLFTLQKKNGNVFQLHGQTFFIRSNTNGYHLSLYGVLKLSQPNQHDQTQQFIINQVDAFQPKPLRETILLSDPISKYCLDIKQNQKVFLNKVSNSLSQRWTTTPSLICDQMKSSKQKNGMTLQPQQQGRIYQISNFQAKKALMIKKNEDKEEMIILDLQSSRSKQWIIECDNYSATIKSKTFNKYLGISDKEVCLISQSFRWMIQKRSKQS